MQIAFYFDVVCPWAYLAATRIDAFAASLGRTVVWKPVLLGGLFRHHGAPQAIGGSEARRAVGLRDLYRYAERLGVPLEVPPEHPRRTVEAMRLVTAAPESVRPALALEIYRANFLLGQDISDREVLAEIGARHGVAIERIDDAAVSDALMAATEEAAEKGVFGVPTAEVDGELFWGLDRFPVIERRFRAACTSELAPAVVGASGRTVRFFHDFASPYSYLASTQIEAVAARARARVEWTPILLGGLFRQIGTPDAPILTFHAVKQAYIGKDLNDWARHWGIPFRFPAVFPQRTVLALRVAIAEPRVTPYLYRAMWVDGVDLGDERALEAVLRAGGFDAAALFATAGESGIKERLRENTDRARDAGACGVPSFLVDERILFWGQDRFEQLESALNGWLPERG
jgi:2-hydroxychromene-2-carboxylate isomerase